MLSAELEKLQQDFPNDVELNPKTGDLTIKRNIKFATNEAKISNASDAKFLTDFIPKWAKIITKDTYSKLIIGLTVEGTADPKGAFPTREENYQYNLRLSQERAREVTRFILQECKKISKEHRSKLRELLSSSGRSDVEGYLALERAGWSDAKIRADGDKQQYRSVRLRLSLFNPLLEWGKGK